MTHDGSSRSARAGVARGRLVSRRRAAGTTPAAAPGTWLAAPADFDYTRTLGFLNPRTVPAMEVTTPARYVRTVWLDPGALRALAGTNGAHDEAGGFEFTGAVTLAIAPTLTDASTPAGASTLAAASSLATASTFAAASPVDAAGGLLIESAPHLPDAVRRLLVTRMFDLDADLAAFFAAVSRDRVLGPIVRRQPPLRLPQVLDPFEGLVRAVLGQQVTVKAATTMVDRLVRRFGTEAPVLASGFAPTVASSIASSDATTGVPAFAQASQSRGQDDAADATSSDATTARLMAFPRPEAIASAGDETLRSIGLTRAKAATLSRLAQAVGDGRLDCVRLRTRDAEDTQAALVALPGIGPWTASYVRMRALGDRDAFPLADLGVIKALDARGVPRDRHAAVAERWRPWRAYATLHLWQSLATG